MPPSVQEVTPGTDTESLRLCELSVQMAQPISLAALVRLSRQRGRLSHFETSNPARMSSSCLDAGLRRFPSTVQLRKASLLRGARCHVLLR
jgi:hypothetical protein